ncbi:MAG: flagellar basal body P-ring protein FlgI [Phycisphaerae bacterium]
MLTCVWPAFTCVLLALLCVGCNNRKLPAEQRPSDADQVDPLLRDTIGESCVLADAEPLRLRGFGVVVGLGESGGSDVPESIREYLIDFLTKEMTSKSESARPAISPDRLLSSPDAAVVEIQGIVPAGAPQGSAFDIQVEAVGTQARSIEGGMLLPCELKIFESAASGQGLIGGKALARARGPVFTNPFAPESEDVTPNPRKGFVLGGGRSMQARSVRVLLDQPSYSMARRIEGRLNERFGPREKIAEAMSEGYVVLKTPAAYATNPKHFLDVAMRVMMQGSSGMQERRVREMTEGLGETRDRLNDIALVWEGMGKGAIPLIQPLYSNDDPEVRFYAVRAGLRLGDTTAVSAMGQIASAKDNRYALRAVRELAECEMSSATGRLYALLSHDDDDRRIAAYQGLVDRRHPSVQTMRFRSALDRSQTGLVLDVIESSGKPLIHVRRSREPRIAVFGGNALPLQVPMFFNHPKNLVTLNAAEQNSEVSLFCRTRASGKLSDTISVPPRVIDLIRGLAALPMADEQGRFPGIGLNYSSIVEVLDALTRDGTIAARLVLENAKLDELLGPKPVERREADEETPTDDDAESSDEARTEPPSAPTDGSPRKERPE